MSEATITHKIETKIPGVEIVELEVSDGETYVYTKGKFINGVILSNSLPTLTDEKHTASISSQTATIELIGTDTTDIKMYALVVGSE